VCECECECYRHFDIWHPQLRIPFCKIKKGNEMRVRRSIQQLDVKTKTALLHKISIEVRVSKAMLRTKRNFNSDRQVALQNLIT